MKKSGIEKLFVMVVLCSAVLCLFSLTGCGSSSCEKPMIDCSCSDSRDIGIVSVPGCGGCFSSGEGCNSCLYSQRCIGAASCVDEENRFSSIDGSVVGFINEYYGDGCGGCGCDSTPNTSYMGCFKGEIERYFDEGDSGCYVFWGNDEEGETHLGCQNGCFACNNEESEELLEYILYYGE